MNESDEEIKDEQAPFFSQMNGNGQLRRVYASDL